MHICFSQGTIFAIQSAYLDLLDVITQISYAPEYADVESHRREAEQFVIALIASVVSADGKVTDEEADFLCKLLNVGDRPGGAIRYVNGYSAKWGLYQKSPPGFVTAAAICDPESARAILRKIQIIGNNAATPDGVVTKSEFRIVRECLKSLDAELDRCQEKISRNS